MLVVKNARRRGKVIEILSEEHENYDSLHIARDSYILHVYGFLL